MENSNAKSLIDAGFSKENVVPEWDVCGDIATYSLLSVCYGESKVCGHTGNELWKKEDCAREISPVANYFYKYTCESVNLHWVSDYVSLRSIILTG